MRSRSWPDVPPASTALSEAEEARLFRSDLVEVDVVETGLLERADLLEHRLGVRAARITPARASGVTISASCSK